MLLGVFLVLAGLFAVLGSIFAFGKGRNLIAGYNTLSREEKAKVDEKKLLISMSVFMFAFTGSFLVSALGQVFAVKALIWIGQVLFAAALIICLIYMNTGDRFKKLDQ